MKRLVSYSRNGPTSLRWIKSEPDFPGCRRNDERLPQSPSPVFGAFGTCRAGSGMSVSGVGEADFLILRAYVWKWARNGRAVTVAVPAAHHGSDFLNSRVRSAATLPSISGVTTLRTNIAVSKNRVATTSAVTDTVRYCFDALYIKPLPAIHCSSPQGHTTASPSRRAIWWRADGDLTAPTSTVAQASRNVEPGWRFVMMHLRALAGVPTT
jgi:hypothetical protein